ncbi:hypothetical protein [Zunongwangia endophytica]|uniref:Uncharacterized protein n=1 Tax=Zunongwangia endophytica TaxID=1808945 RepID=A0ABV8H9R4_9FLAO|nr:hypothetical protein [Zunongwangia endophytica]MDN3594846.1 hypothetical protein [Zunongwangia endophytica]
MIGFELKVKGEVFNAALNKGVLTVILTKHNNIIDIHFGGLNTENDENLHWLDTTLGLDEEIKVTVKDILKNSEPKSIRKKEKRSQDKIDLQKYYSLKKKLEGKGLI